MIRARTVRANHLKFCLSLSSASCSALANTLFRIGFSSGKHTLPHRVQLWQTLSSASLSALANTLFRIVFSSGKHTLPHRYQLWQALCSASWLRKPSQFAIDPGYSAPPFRPFPPSLRQRDRPCKPRNPPDDRCGGQVRYLEVLFVRGADHQLIAGGVGGDRVGLDRVWDVAHSPLPLTVCVSSYRRCLLCQRGEGSVRVLENFVFDGRREGPPPDWLRLSGCW